MDLFLEFGKKPSAATTYCDFSTKNSKEIKKFEPKNYEKKHNFEIFTPKICGFHICNGGWRKIKINKFRFWFRAKWRFQNGSRDDLIWMEKRKEKHISKLLNPVGFLVQQLNTYLVLFQCVWFLINDLIWFDMEWKHKKTNDMFVVWDNFDLFRTGHFIVGHLSLKLLFYA